MVKNFRFAVLIFSAAALIQACRTDHHRAKSDNPLLLDNRHWRTLKKLDQAAAKASGKKLAAVLRESGELRLHLGDFSGAEADFRRAFELLPDDSSLLYLRASALRDRPEEAVAYADRAADAARTTAVERAKANLLAGELRMDIGDREGAAKRLELALKDAPEDLDVLRMMVRLKRGSGALPYAEQAEQAAGRAPVWRRAAARRFVARIWLELEEHARVAANLRLALQSNPEDIDALAPLVLIKDSLTRKQLSGLRRAETEAEAAAAGATALPTPNEETAQSALREDPNDLEALRQLVVLHRDGSRRAKAVEYATRFGQAIGRSPVWQRAEASRVLSALWLDLENPMMAGLTLDQARDLKSDDVETWRMLAALPDGAKATSPTHIYCLAAQMRIDLGDPDGAEQALRLALKADPSNSWAGRLLASLGKAP